MEGLAADDPLKTLDYVNRSFKSCKSKHPYINNQIIRSCLAYQYLLKVYLNLNIGIWDILSPVYTTTLTWVKLNLGSTRGQPTFVYTAFITKCSVNAKLG